MKKVVISFTVAFLFLVLLLPTSLASGDPVISDLVAAPYAFNSETGSTSINYTLTDVDGGNVWLEIYDSKSVLVRTIDGYVQNSGAHSIVWDGKDDNGNLVAEGDYIARLNVSAGRYEFVLKWGSPGSGEGQFKSPMGAAVDSSGNVYVADCDNHRIQKFYSNGTFITKWGSYVTARIIASLTAPLV